ncbi:signal peptidase II [Synechococcus sp. CS-1325]|uniref:signal peptidase II n=1 Tax=unclassified Synechococcus TaxID=2626047 RepID=UPI000DB7264D|nr:MULTISPECIES: signal peptidase II [unclassified Synechococcus]PZU97550.1 MAG: signal peptidase II [Cyanobium sp.]MCT0200875.1 signal peptidase II [Synechococcus sp. CS-1325]MCT0213913.1 signal peptidase II [Synechococcus sp. CS-1326]MCT0230815.1 signal peptidase II [Synechococcus sp. CS-1324]MCT0233489.1 signal peptidase II [Synechococcus sp. CS-1327]
MTLPVQSRRRVAWLIAAAVVLLDQLSKAWAGMALAPAAPQPFLPGLLRLRLVFNTGAAFSLFQSSTALLGLVSFLVGIGLIVWIQRQDSLRRWQAVGLGALLGGALGNGLDRWRLGGVVDFLELVPFPFPVFNLADLAINVAVACLALDLWEGRSGAGR